MSRMCIDCHNLALGNKPILEFEILVVRAANDKLYCPQTKCFRKYGLEQSLTAEFVNCEFRMAQFGVAE